LPAVEMILLASLEGRFSYEEVQFKTLCRPVTLLLKKSPWVILANNLWLAIYSSREDRGIARVIEQGHIKKNSQGLKLINLSILQHALLTLIILLHFS